LEAESVKYQELQSNERQVRENETRINEEVQNLKNEIERLKSSNELAELRKENAELKETLASASKTVELPPNFNVLSPRTQKTELNKLPAWKIREMERQKELDAQRNEEQNRKLVKVQSIKVGGTIDHSSQNPNFKDPVEQISSCQR